MNHRRHGKERTRWPGRAAELSLNANFEFPVGDEPLLPAAREKVWRVIGAITLPWGDSAKIPISVTLASDPNSCRRKSLSPATSG